ncbi:succinylglutamate desuccinylase [Fusobacterium sp. IOR10]|uniref:succinylglutamate desuccinylase n=1 Tax=Fusobacterium sp. IOR10 TaxID=2665157 RepID=UPI0013D562E3|nr:succinylglutamate desuccinylase [Fusobacterium sp. IOR10]
MIGNKKTAIGILVCSLMVAFLAGKEFVKMREPAPIYKGEGVTDVKMLSEYFPGIKGTHADTEVYILKGKEKGGSTLVLGGTHPNEPSAYLAAITIIENAKVNKGTIYVVPRTNNSAFSHNDPQEASPQRFHIKTKNGERWFRYGSRATNPLDQWPDPDVYIHASSGQHLSGSETRNINRAYPGRKDGTFTEKAAYGIVQLVKKNNINLEIDLHEASPEYPVINAMVAHERAMELASTAVMNLEFDNIKIGLEPSPVNLRGLTHREIGDYTDAYAVLMETANASQGRLRGKTDEKLVLTGIDPTYVKAQKLGRLYVPYDEKGHPIEERVGRHTTGVIELINAMGDIEPNKAIEVEGIPTKDELMENGLGNYLHDPE